MHKTGKKLLVEGEAGEVDVQAVMLNSLNHEQALDIRKRQVESSGVLRQMPKESKLVLSGSVTKLQLKGTGNKT